MVVVKVLDESRVDRIEGFVFLLGKELLSDRAEEPFHLGPALGAPGRRVRLLHGQISTDDFQVTTVVGRTIVRIQPLGDPMAPHGGHQFDDQALGRLGGIKPAADHIAGEIIDDDMQVKCSVTGGAWLFSVFI